MTPRKCLSSCFLVYPSWTGKKVKANHTNHLK
uniref:Uncharacterized protein n=1 Tax=Arundo donax TaxID=35708 RepID=A0A0A9GUV3_ARUDO